MKATRFTDTFLSGLRPAAKACKVRDRSEAVGIQVAPGGTRTFFVALPVDGRQRYIGLERYCPPVTDNGRRVEESNLAGQSTRARKLRAIRDGGQNPIRWLADEADQRRTGTFEQLLDAYLTHLGVRPSVEHARRIFEHDIRPHVDPDMPAREVTAAHVTAALARIRRRGAVVQANRAHSYVSAAIALLLATVDAAPTSRAARSADGRPSRPCLGCLRRSTRYSGASGPRRCSRRLDGLGRGATDGAGQGRGAGRVRVLDRPPALVTELARPTERVP